MIALRYAYNIWEKRAAVVVGLEYLFFWDSFHFCIKFIAWICRSYQKAFMAWLRIFKLIVLPEAFSVLFWDLQRNKKTKHKFNERLKFENINFYAVSAVSPLRLQLYECWERLERKYPKNRKSLSFVCFALSFWLIFSFRMYIKFVFIVAVISLISESANGEWKSIFKVAMHSSLFTFFEVIEICKSSGCGKS